MVFNLYFSKCVEGIVRNKTILFLISSVIFVTIALSALNIFNTESEIKSLTLEQKRDAVAHATEQINEFDMFLYSMNNEFLKSEKNSIIYINQWFKQNNINPLEVQDETLKKLVNKLDISQIYIIDKNGEIKRTSFEADKGINLINKNNAMKNYLNIIYGKGTINNQGMSFSNKMGKLNRYTYYSPINSDYIIEVSIDVKEYIKNKYGQNYYNFLFKDLFEFSKYLGKSKVSIEIYNSNGDNTWSLLDEGKKLNLTDEEFKKLENNNEIIKNKDAVSYYYYQLKVPYKSFINNQKFYVEIKYDSSEILRTEKETILKSVLISSFIIIIFYFIIRRFLNKFIIEKVEKINDGLLEISTGEYSKDILIGGKDEFAQIALNINIMKNQIKDRENKISTMAYYDPVTDLPNKAFLQRELNDRIYMLDEYSGIRTMIILQIHNFAKITDILGPIAGEEVLLTIVSFLKSKWKTAFIARKSDNEFAMLEDFENEQDMKEKMENLMIELGKENFILSKSIYTIFNAGVVIYPDHGTTSEELFKNGDLALHNIENRGHNEYLYYSEEMEKRLIDRLVMEKELKEALIKDEIKVVYQPKVDVKTGKIKSAEALVRWEKQNGEKIFPNEFIPLAEETGLIIDIGNYVLRKSCMQMKEWREKNLPRLKVSVNLSVVQFQQKNLQNLIENTLKEAGLEPDALELEITESLLIEDISKCNKVLEDIRKSGVHIALDDFGKGYSSLNYLKNLGIDTLKIDKAFVDDIVSLNDKQIIIDSLIEMAHGLNISVVSEGVENSTQVEYLQVQGCDELQGYFFSKPISAEAFEQILIKDAKLL